MREIEFRGKRKDSGEWVRGYYVIDKQHGKIDLFCHYIFTGLLSATLFYEKYEIYPATVGQYTGLKDSKRTEKYPEGQEIYEGDIIQMPHVKTDGYFIDENGMWRSVVVCGKDGRWESNNGMGFRFAYGLEVVGNIHQNPELLEGGLPND